MSDASALAVQMPLLARTLRVWDGIYTRIDPAGHLLDRDRSRLTSAWLDDGTYMQPHAYASDPLPT